MRSGRELTCFYDFSFVSHFLLEVGGRGCTSFFLSVIFKWGNIIDEKVSGGFEGQLELLKLRASWDLFQLKDLKLSSWVVKELFANSRWEKMPLFIVIKHWRKKTVEFSFRRKRFLFKKRVFFSERRFF